MNEIPPLLEAEVLEGLQRLLTLRLPGSPAQDTIILTSDTWSNAVYVKCGNWQDNLDKGRISFAFAKLFASVDKWPTPKQLIELIPPRSQPKVKVLNAPKRSPEEIEAQRIKNAKNRDKLQQIFNSLFKNKEMPR